MLQAQTSSEQMQVMQLTAALASSHDVAATSYPGLGLDDAWRGAERACGGGGVVGPSVEFHI